MLKVKTKLGKSTIEGIGLFADQDIPKGTVIWEYSKDLDREYEAEEFEALSELDKIYVKKYSFKSNGVLCLCVDDARFYNHSETPNSIEIIYGKFGISAASQDIKKGEELTTDYRKFGINETDVEFNLEF